MQEKGTQSGGNWVFSLIISGDALDFAGIEQMLGLAPSDIRHKGETLNRLPPVISPEDVWIHEMELYDNEGADPRMQNFLQVLENNSKGLQALAQNGSVVLRLYVKSEYAQIFYRLVPSTLQRLAAIGLPLEVSVVSWGGMRFEPTD